MPPGSRRAGLGSLVPIVRISPPFLSADCASGSARAASSRRSPMLPPRCRCPIRSLRDRRQRPQNRRCRRSGNAGPDGRKQSVSRLDLDDPPAGPAEREPCEARVDAERLMCRRMIMMIVEDRVTPPRRPVMIGEQRLESLRCFLALGADGAAINFDRQPLIVRQPAVRVQDERFAFHDNSFPLYLPARERIVPWSRASGNRAA